MKDSRTTHFGFEEIRAEEKSGRVKAVFDSVAGKYDLMNDLMSFGIHRYWKSAAVEVLELEPGFKVLDLAAGTGDLSVRIAPVIGRNGVIVAADINRRMLITGRDRLLNEGITGNLKFVLADAENLPFAENLFDRVIIGFGLRNVTNKEKALKSILQALKPGGKLVVLEFSHPAPPFAAAYDVYSFAVLPVLGKIITHDADSYRYLAESIRKHPSQTELEQMFVSAGFTDTEFVNLTTGIVAVHSGYKP